MNKIFSTCSLVVLLLTTLSCGPSIKVTDTWKADDINKVKAEKLLVMVRADDAVTRQRFEDEITNKLVSEGVNAVQSYKTYPTIKLNQKHSDEDIDRQVSKFKNDGIEGIVLTVLKDIKTEIITQETGGGYYPSYYGGFGHYYGRYYSPYGVGGVYIPSSSRTYASDIYKMETVIYDLLRTEGKQLVGVVSVDVTDPKSASQIAAPYAEKVIAQFNEGR